VNLLDPELVEQRRHVVAPGLHRVHLVRPLGLAVAAQVEVERPVSRAISGVIGSKFWCPKPAP
jgi:hypothetical protein